ncbi:hypothetical protein BB560_001716 [Smittium megazygosporum]|uniref:BHLH domain-containing protein n=1 Tax=Smittium megazygosporum TaxID=133381 RepID=A0A2T9ZGS9_9FUNG|nr:hypothetical protein BB560_001716 [Smittium megazygosporum]
MNNQTDSEFLAYQLQLQHPSDILKKKFLENIPNSQTQPLNIEANRNAPLTSSSSAVNPLSPMFLYDFANATTLTENINKTAQSNAPNQNNSSKFYSNLSDTIFTDPSTPESSSYAKGVPIQTGTTVPTSNIQNNFSFSPFMPNQAMKLSSSLNSNSLNNNRQFPNTPAKLDMFPPLFDETNDLTPDNSYNPSSLASKFNEYSLNSGNEHLALGTTPGDNFLHQNAVQFGANSNNNMPEIRSFGLGSPANSSHYSSSLPTATRWDQSSAGLGPSDIQRVIEKSPYFGSIGVQNQQTPLFSPAGAYTGSIDLRDTEIDPRRAQIISEKRRRRRESHNAVERRRRDNINEQIQELYNLLPSHIKDPNIKPNKGLILSKSVSYIKELKSKLAALSANQEQNHKIYPSGISVSQTPSSTRSGLASILSNEEGIISNSSSNT